MTSKCIGPDYATEPNGAFIAYSEPVHQTRGSTRIRTENLLRAKQLLFQLELQTQETVALRLKAHL